MSGGFEDDDLNVLGYIKTEAECPLCDEVNSYEGDCSSERVRCTACGEEFYIREVR